MRENSRKKTSWKISHVIVVAFSTMMFSEAGAQESIFDYLTQALSKVVTEATIVNLANYDYVDGNSLFGVYLPQGDYHSLNMQFDGGVSYLVLGAGDDDIVDLDLALLSSDGRVLQEDADHDATPILRFTPTYSGKRTLKITNYESYRAGFCVMVILKESYTGNFSLNQLGEALGNVIRNSRITYLFSSNFARGTFCLFGGRLGKGQETYIYNTQPSPGQYAMVGAGSNNISDVDLFVVRQNGRDNTYGAEISKDTAIDNHPICSFTVYSGWNYLLKHKNYSSSGSSDGFVFSVLLQL